MRRRRAVWRGWTKQQSRNRYLCNALQPSSQQTNIFATRRFFESSGAFDWCEVPRPTPLARSERLYWMPETRIDRVTFRSSDALPTELFGHDKEKDLLATRTDTHNYHESHHVSFSFTTPRHIFDMHLHRASLAMAQPTHPGWLLLIGLSTHARARERAEQQ